MPGQTERYGGGVPPPETPSPPAEVRVVAGLAESDYARATEITCQAYFYRLSSVACAEEETMAYFRWRLMRRLGDGVALGAFSGSELVGLALVRPGGHPRAESFSRLSRLLSRILLAPVNKGDYVLDSLAVDTPWRGKGIGSLLLHASIEYVRAHGGSSLRLEVAAPNHAAVHFFVAKGFAIMRAWGYRSILRLLGHAMMHTLTIELD